jgi:hypothetical protein
VGGGCVLFLMGCVAWFGFPLSELTASWKWLGKKVGVSLGREHGRLLTQSHTGLVNSDSVDGKDSSICLIVWISVSVSLMVPHPLVIVARACG